MPDFPGSGKTPAAHNAAEAGATTPTASADSARLSYGVTRNANESRSITSNGETISPVASAGQVSTVVIQEINAPTMCQVVYNVDTNWTQSDFDQFKPGAKLEIVEKDMQDAKLAPLYVSGATLDARTGQGMRLTLTVTAFDKMHYLRFGAYTMSFPDKDDAAIFRWLASSVGLTLSADGLRKGNYPYILQDNEISYDFLLRRCHEGNYVCLVQAEGRTEKLVVKPRRYDDSVADTLVYNFNVEEISLDMRVPTLGSTVVARGYDITGGNPVMGSFSQNLPGFKMKGAQTGFDAAKPFGSSPVMLRCPDLIDESSLEHVAAAKRARLQNTFVEGSATLRKLNFKAAPGTNVMLEGMSGSFDGLYFVVKATHRIDHSRNVTTLSLTRSGM